MSTPPDPYTVLGIRSTATDEELRSAYRRLVQLHHPDHNNGSRESALRFAEVQEAYAHVKLLRKRETPPDPGAATASSDPGLDSRIAAMERELRAAREQREKAARAAAQEAARAAAAADAQKRTAEPRAQPQHAGEQRTADEELGYYSTDDSFTKIFDDFAGQVTARFNEAHQAAEGAEGAPRGDAPRKPRSVADWIDELGSRLTGDQQRKKQD